MPRGPDSKELYQQLRTLPWARLWAEEVPRFDRALPRERFERVAVIRAVGVVFAASGPVAQRDAVGAWLRGLLGDPQEKIRRYAMAALPKIGAGADDEAALLALRATATAREEKSLARTLDKIGGAATLAAIESAGAFTPHTAQKVRASVARSESPSTVLLDRTLTGFARLRIHLRGRKGLEEIVRDEVDEHIRAHGKFRVLAVESGLVALTPVAPFALADLFALRCFGTLGLVLGLVKTPPSDAAEALAAAIASPLSRRLLTAFTDGPLRYRLEFIGQGHQRAAVQRIADRAYALCPEILNDAREAPWAVDIHRTRHGDSVELRPRLSPDPRYAYRVDDVPAASHPPLAACLARVAGCVENEVVWDPFCGSGLELIERARRGGVAQLHGTDRSPQAVGIAEKNFAAAQLGNVPAEFTCCDFRDAAIAPQSVSLILTNPPLGRRVRIPDLRGLFDDLFATAARVLRPGGRLVLTNPFRLESPPPALKLQSRQVVDLGGFDCRLEVYRKRTRG